MYKYKFSTGVVVMSLLTCLIGSSCSKQIDNAYQNPNASVVEPVEQLLPSVIANFVGGANTGNGGNGTGGDAREIGRYIQFWANNTTGNQYDQMGGTTGNNGGTLGYVWTMHYATMGQNINKIAEWGAQQKKWDYVGVAWAIRAWSWLTLSDEYGNIILREAFQLSRTQFDYDTLQSEAYDTVRATAYRALTYLNMTGDSVSQANLAKGDTYFYGGDVSKWKKFVYGVLARSYAHLTNKPDFKTKYADSVIKYTDLAMTQNSDNGYVTFANTGVSGTMNYFGPTRNNMGPLRQTSFIANLLSGNNTVFPGIQDPRVWYLIRENPNGTFMGIRPSHGASPGDVGLSTNDQPQNFWGGVYTVNTGTNTSARYLFRNEAPFPMMTASEMQFDKAEAAYRKGDKSTALNSYINGINLSFDMLTTTYSANVPAANLITPASQQAYMSNPQVVPTDPANLTLSQIMLQKYIALYAWGAHETWVDMRRYHYTDTDPDRPGVQVYTDWTPLAPADIWPFNGGKYVYRARPQNTSEFQYNIIAVTAMGGTALDYCTKEEWFSTPNAQ
ncbi:MAG TPA: SusD/RagB family nutrient-binding outer membrane lipoprotein [Puia sp.]|nr:SusD/RagB family nutrient-binding outer membrane lipoprotein [Puia sp.]